jgi:CMP-N,N'-diacetyllegionaminic acid synthase
MNLAVIPCRKGSKGIPGKNFKMLAGKPLYEWTLTAAKESKCFNLIIVSSDGGLDKPLVSRERKVFFDNDRPDEYSTDEAQLEPLLLYYTHRFGADVITLLQPTSPLRSSSDIVGAFSVFNDGGCDSVVSVTSVGDKYWMKLNDSYIPMYNPSKRLNRQNDATNLLFYEDGAIYICKRWLLDEGNRIGGKIGMYHMPQERSHQIDSEFDFKVCEAVLG